MNNTPSRSATESAPPSSLVSFSESSESLSPPTVPPQQVAALVNANRHRVISPADAALEQSYPGLWLRQAGGLLLKSALVARGRTSLSAVRLLLPPLLALLIFLTIQFAGDGGSVQPHTGQPLSPIPRCIAYAGGGAPLWLSAAGSPSCRTIVYAPQKNDEVDELMRRFAATQPMLSWPDDFEALPLAPLPAGMRKVDDPSQLYSPMQKYLEAHQNYTLGALHFGLDEAGRISQYFVFYNDSVSAVEQDLIGRATRHMQNNYRLQLVASVEEALTDMYWDTELHGSSNHSSSNSNSSSSMMALAEQVDDDESRLLLGEVSVSQVRSRPTVATTSSAFPSLGSFASQTTTSSSSSVNHTLQLSVADFPTLGTGLFHSNSYILIAISLCPSASLFLCLFCLSSTCLYWSLFLLSLLRSSYQQPTASSKHNLNTLFVRLLSSSLRIHRYELSARCCHSDAAGTHVPGRLDAVRLLPGGHGRRQGVRLPGLLETVRPQGLGLLDGHLPRADCVCAAARSAHARPRLRHPGVHLLFQLELCGESGHLPHLWNLHERTRLDVWQFGEQSERLVGL
mmetsp:Transcript_5062/g.15441  ORF Transcript_5062/g.15441 Transcript_5062/m.15441 type:complete len:569 (+) Transcript_5062:3100-4806(+)